MRTSACGQKTTCCTKWRSSSRAGPSPAADDGRPGHPTRSRRPSDAKGSNAREDAQDLDKRCGVQVSDPQPQLWITSVKKKHARPHHTPLAAQGAQILGRVWGRAWCFAHSWRRGDARPPDVVEATSLSFLSGARTLRLRCDHFWVTLYGGVSSLSYRWKVSAKLNVDLDETKTARSVRFPWRGFIIPVRGVGLRGKRSTGLPLIGILWS